MIRKTFIVERHEEYGELGLRPIDMPHADPLRGMAVAHDILEHFMGDDGGAEAELQALGASIWVRGEEYFYAKDFKETRPSHHIAADFIELWRHIRYEGFGLRSPDGGAGNRTLEEEWDEAQVVEAVRIGCNNIIDEFEQNPSAPNRHNMRRYLRIGYRRARARFRGIPQYRLASVFQEIESAADIFMLDAIEGQELKISVDPGREIVRVETDLE